MRSIFEGVNWIPVNVNALLDVKLSAAERIARICSLKDRYLRMHTEVYMRLQLTPLGGSCETTNTERQSVYASVTM